MVVASINLSNLNGSNGFVTNGIGEDEVLKAVNSAGDVNGDGIDDFIIGNRTGFYDDDLAGKSYVVFGSSSGFDASFDLSDLDGSNGFTINTIETGDLSGRFVSGAGDFNGDGIDDIIIGAPYAANSNGMGYTGESYVVFGSSNGFDSSLELSDLNTSDGFVLKGIDFEDFSGRSVSNAGDVNDDGIDDIIIAASNADPNSNSRAGESYVVFGRNSGLTASLDLSDLDGSNGFVLNGINPGDFSGGSVSNAGDVNGDGIDDLIIGASSADPNGNENAGESYIVFGSSNGFDSSLELSALNASNGFTINGVDAFDGSGRSVSGAGDVNGDGIDDIIIGAPFANPNGNENSGESYIVFGSKNGFDSNLDLSSLNGSNGFVLKGINANDRSASSVSGAGDVNGDGFNDVIIGAPFFALTTGRQNFGESYVVFGSDSPFPASLDLSAIDGNNGFLITGFELEIIDIPSISVSGAGDINSDGFDDMIIGSGQSGESYVVFGFSTDSEEEINGTDDSDELVGTEENDTINGFEGEDTVAGNAGDDLINGGEGDDVLRGDENRRASGGVVGGDDTIIGGAGDDRIGGKGGDDELFGSEGDDSIWGDDGDDLIQGGLGDDLLTGDDFSGGSGSDTFILATGEGTDTITDFEVGIDQIDLEGLTFEDLSISSVGSQTEIAFGDETLAILQGVTETLTESDFV
ncbi:MAG: hypothetical protein AAFO04_02445 [Cyanobacteria bacterium J06592_8]